MKNILLFAALLTAACPVFIGGTVNAQITFQRTYGGSADDVAYCVRQTNDGGYIISGYTHSFGAGNRDIFVIKTDQFGDTLWTRAMGTVAFDWGAKWIEQTADNGYVLTGHWGGIFHL